MIDTKELLNNGISKKDWEISDEVHYDSMDSEEERTNLKEKMRKMHEKSGFKHVQCISEE